MKVFDDGFQVYFSDIPEGVKATDWIRQNVPEAAFFRKNRFGYWGRLKGQHVTDAKARALKKWKQLEEDFGPQSVDLLKKLIEIEEQQTKNEFINIPENEIAGH